MLTVNMYTYTFIIIAHVITENDKTDITIIRSLIGLYCWNKWISVLILELKSKKKVGRRGNFLYYFPKHRLLSLSIYEVSSYFSRKQKLHGVIRDSNVRTSLSGPALQATELPLISLYTESNQSNLPMKGITDYISTEQNYSQCSSNTGIKGTKYFYFW